MQLLRCDACLTEGPGPSGMMSPPDGWAHITLVESEDLGAKLAHQLGSITAGMESFISTEDREARAQALKSVAKKIARPHTHGPGGCLDLCPACVATLTITVRGESVLTALRRQEHGET